MTQTFGKFTGRRKNFSSTYSLRQMNVFVARRGGKSYLTAWQTMMSMLEGDPRQMSALCLLRDYGESPHQIFLTKLNNFSIVSTASQVFVKDNGKWICTKDRHSGITNWEPDRRDLAQWLLEAKNI
jgi:hypothetical protein